MVVPNRSSWPVPTHSGWSGLFSWFDIVGARPRRPGPPPHGVLAAPGHGRRHDASAATPQGGALRRVRVRRAAPDHVDDGAHRGVAGTRSARDRRPRLHRHASVGARVPMQGVQARWDRHPDAREVGFALYVLLDEVVDGYLTAVESLEDEADELEDLVFERDGGGRRRRDVQQRLFRLKRDIVRAAPLGDAAAPGHRHDPGGASLVTAGAGPVLPRRGGPRDQGAWSSPTTSGTC